MPAARFYTPVPRRSIPGAEEPGSLSTPSLSATELLRRKVGAKVLWPGVNIGLTK
jgi:hypothetical protein